MIMPLLLYPSHSCHYGWICDVSGIQNQKISTLVHERIPKVFDHFHESLNVACKGDLYSHCVLVVPAVVPSCQCGYPGMLFQSRRWSSQFLVQLPSIAVEL